jgi:hypothetical protein
MPAMKGDAIVFIGGKYAGKTGWINTNKEAGENTTPVIVDLGSKGKKETYVFRQSFRKEKVAASYAEAVLVQCPDIEVLMTKLCRNLAKCSIEQDASGVVALFNKKLNEAIALQEAKGAKALYRHVTFRNAATTRNAPS